MSLSSYTKIISDAFDSKSWNYSSKNIDEKKNLFSLNFSSDNQDKISCKVFIHDDGICDIEAVLPFKCPSDKFMELSYFLSQENYSKRYATLRLDVKDGEIQNSYSYIFNNSTTHQSFLSRFLNVKDVDDSVFSQLQKICNISKNETSTLAKEDTILDTPSPKTSLSPKSKNRKFKLDL